ncbi:hypothetical protein ACEWY4_020316 [Coilia grayii]|uniref:Fucolectin tachylectin-4 pentraxin-1 domain-containing protein n=1 Tax=Coilia grayii TaxID=363190 RepID=A0ABD1JFD0_9TELE
METLFLFICLLIPGFTVQAKNLALNGKATQSDLVRAPTSGEAIAQNAIDGNRDSNFFHGSCTHTDTQNNPWWRVDLLKEYIITSVVITNRGDCCPERLNGAEIRIGNSLLDNGNLNPLAGVISSIPAGRSLTLRWGTGVKGRYVNVFLPGHNKVLTLCEVEVYGYLAPNEAHLNPWWRVDLLQKHKVFSVIITVDSAPSRLNGAEIRIGNSLDNNGINNPRCAVISSIPGGFSETFQCKGMEGRYVTVVIPGRAEYLILCEVEVYGSPLE